MTDASDDRRHFFISYNQADRKWAAWIAWVLEENGYSVFFQEWDFHGSFIEHMHQASLRAERTLAVLSDHYLSSEYARCEVWAALASDPVGHEDRVVTVKIGPTTESLGVLSHFGYLDLDTRTEADAERLLVKRARMAVEPGYRDKPLDRPGFPGGSKCQVPEKPNWTHRLDELLRSGQIAELVHQEVFDLIEKSHIVREHVERRERDWFAKTALSLKNAKTHQVLAALCCGIDIQVTLSGITFSMIPPGHIHSQLENRCPYYLSAFALTTNALNSLPYDVVHSLKMNSQVCGLSAALATEVIQALNGLSHSAAILGGSDAGPHLNESVLYSFRLPKIRELEFVAAIHGHVLGQCCRSETDVTDTARHVFGIAGLVGGLEQLCDGEENSHTWVWGGALGRNRIAEFSQGVPAYSLDNSFVGAPYRGLRLLAEPTSLVAY